MQEELHWLAQKIAGACCLMTDSDFGKQVKLQRFDQLQDQARPAVTVPCLLG